MNIYIVYKTTNLLNNKIYIGSHLCIDKIEDDYLGSNLILENSIKKHGIKNFKRETLEIILEIDKKLSNQEWYDIVLPVETKWIRHFAKLLGKELLYNINCQNAFGGCTTKGTIWIHNGIKSKMIPNSNLIPDGWIKGRIGNIGSGNKGRVLCTNLITKEEKYISPNKIPDGWVKGSEKTCIIRSGSSNPSFGKKWMKNDTLKLKAYTKDEVIINKLISEGWIYGSKKNYPCIKRK